MPDVTIDLVHLKPAQVPWDSLYLDPNNPRLAGMGESVVVPDDEITNPELQADLASSLKEVGITDITDKIRALGFLQIDRIVVRPIAGEDGAYVVLEGNRRVAALKSIRGNPALYSSIAPALRPSLELIDVLIYEGHDDDIAWVIQGFRHIESIKDWGPFQQGRYLVDLQERRKLKVNEVAGLAGIGRNKASRLIRSFHGWKQAKASDDFGDQVNEQDFSVFQEAIFHQNESPLWKWLDWDDSDGARQFKNTARLGKLLTLLKEKPNGGLPRIPRVNPDLRDKFSKLVMPGGEKELQSFLDSDKDLDQAYLELQREETVTQTREELVDLGAQTSYLGEVNSRLQTLPIPKIVQAGGATDFMALLESIVETAGLQRSILAGAPDVET